VTKASAVLAVTGGMAASFALPASAVTVTPEAKTRAPASNGALKAPSVPLISRTFGEIAFTGVVKRRPVASSPASYDAAAARRLWEVSERAVLAPV